MNEVQAKGVHQSLYFMSSFCSVNMAWRKHETELPFLRP